MLKVFCGYDERESDGFHVFSESLIQTSSIPVCIIPLHLPMMQEFYSDHSNTGTNAFVKSRFLIPYLCDYKGFAVFMDGADMLMRSDIAELKEYINPVKAVSVVKHDYKTNHPKKYIGTSMENVNLDYPCKNWSSMMLINCSHPAWMCVTPEYVENTEAKSLHRFEFLNTQQIAELPKEWNWLVGEYDHNPRAKIAHFTLGIPSFNHYKNCDYSQEWNEVKRRT